MASTPDFASPRAAPPWRQKAASFWRWWTGEMSRLLPERFALLRAGAGAPMLALEGEEVRLVESHGAAIPGEKSIMIGPLDEPRRKAAVRALLERAGETRGRARVALGRDDVLVRRVTLPAATEENLSQVLGFEMDRLSPFKADEVYFDQRVVARDPTAGQITAELAMARRGLVDARVKELRDLGVSVQGVSLRDDANRNASPLDLLPYAQRGEREAPRLRMIRYSLLFAVIFLFLVALLLPVWKKREAVLALHPVVATAKQEAEATDSIVRELERQANDYNFLLGKKHGTYPALAFVEEVSRLLPDNTFLSVFEIKTVGKNREILVSGETTSSSKLIELLEQSKVIQNAAPRGTVTRGSTPSTERFQIAAEVKPRALPEAQALVPGQVAAPLPAPAPVPFGPPPAAPPTASVTVEPAMPPAPAPQPAQNPASRAPDKAAPR
jgi:general secretion pathway protein L